MLTLKNTYLKTRKFTSKYVKIFSKCYTILKL